MQNSVAKKLFAVGSAVAMTLSLAVPFVASAAAHAEGTNVKKSDGTIGMIIGGQFRPYTSAGAFLSYGFNSWSSVVDANSDDTALTVGAFIPPQDGKVICSDRGTDKGTCYLITGGMKAGFTSAAVFTGLGFSFSKTTSGDVSWMTSTTNISNTTDAHKPGVLINNGGTVQLVGTSGLLGIPDLATFNSWGYSFSYVVPANAADKAMSQNGVMAARTAGQLSPTALASTGTTGTTVTSGSVSVSLSSDTPAAATIVAGQAIADLAHFTFTGTGTVTQVVLKRIGVSSDDTLANVYLYSGNTKLTDAGSVSSGIVTFTNSNGLFTVSGTSVISVKADIKAGVSGQTIGAQLSSYTVASGTPASTSVSGNLMTTATATDIATVKLTNSDAITGGGAVDAGTTNYNLWSGNISVGQRTVYLKYFSFKQIGSISTDAIQNLKLMLDGTQIGSTASVDSTNHVIFDVTSAPVSLTTGGHTLELHGDIVKGSNYTYRFVLQTPADIVLVDSSYNVNLLLYKNDGATQVFSQGPASATINAGSVSVQSDSSWTSTEFVKNASNVTLGQWTMKAYGEDMQVQNMQVLVSFYDSTGAATTTDSSTSEGFNNLAVYVNGGMVGSSQNAVGTSITSVTKTYGSTNLFTIPAGTTYTVAVKGDSTMISGSKIAYVKATLITPAASLQGKTSYNTTPATQQTYTATQLAAKTSSITLAKNSSYSNSTVSTNSTAQKIGSYVIQAGSADGVRVSSLTVVLDGTLNSSNAKGALANLYIVTPAGTATPVNPASSNSFSVNFTVAANSTATVNVYADISNPSSLGYVQTHLYGNGTGVNSSQPVYITLDGNAYTGSSNDVDGQIVTVGTGTLSTPTRTSASPVAQLVVAGKTSQPLATFNFVSTSSSVTITELHFTVTGNNTSTDTPVTAVYVGGQTGTVVTNSSITVTGLNLVVPSGYSGLDVPVTVDYANVGVGGVKSNQTVTLNLTYVKYLSGSTTVVAQPTVSSNQMTLAGTVPTVSLSATSGTLSIGSVKVGSVVVSADSAGNVVLTQLPLVFSTSGGAVVANGANVYVKETSGSTITTTGGTVASGTATMTFTNGYTISAGTSKTFDIYVDVSAPSGLGNSGNSRVALGLGSASNFKWNDVAGNATGLDASAIYNYPSTTVSIAN